MLRFDIIPNDLKLCYCKRCHDIFWPLKNPDISPAQLNNISPEQPDNIASSASNICGVAANINEALAELISAKQIMRTK